MKYGIKTVVSGFHGIKRREVIPFTIARTLIEHRQLSEIIESLNPDARYDTACELGCGYGRMLLVLARFAKRTYGVERDRELNALAKKLFGFEIHTPNDFLPCADLLLTFTFLQHLERTELATWVARIKEIATKTVILCEQTEGDSRHCHGRSVLEYTAMMDGFILVSTELRKLDKASVSNATYMVFRKE